MNIKSLISNWPKSFQANLYQELEEFANLSMSGFSNTSSKALTISNLVRQAKDQNFFLMVNANGDLKEHIQNLELFSATALHILNLEANPHTDKQIQEQNNLELLNFISKLHQGEKGLFIANYVDALSDGYDPKAFANSLDFSTGQTVKNTEVFESLIQAGYQIGQTIEVEQGQYYCRGDIITIFPVNLDFPIRLHLDFEEITSIEVCSLDYQKSLTQLDSIQVRPILKARSEFKISDLITSNTIYIEGELEIIEEDFKLYKHFLDGLNDNKKFSLVSFSEDETNHRHAGFASVLKYHSSFDFISDMQLKKKQGYQTIILSKQNKSIEQLLDDHNVVYEKNLVNLKKNQAGLYLHQLDEKDNYPNAFSHAPTQTLVITDKDIPGVLGKVKKIKNNQQIYLDLLTSLKVSDLIVHADHGIGRFTSMQTRKVQDITKEYIELAYAQGDKLFVPVDQADRISKYIGSEEDAPKLTRLGGTEWANIQKKVNKETQKIAKELLKLFAERQAAKGHSFGPDNDLQDQFEETFPYEETPGQIKAIMDVKKDMETDQPMDRLVCGDVGFGKTEVAMRAAFKAFTNKKQVAFISPITILADQHYKSFQKRMADFHVRVDLLSRFKTKAEQKKILEKLAKGEIDIIIGTHRLLQADVKFKNLGLLIVDEEQRFGVEQKEKLKKIRSAVDILTLTATPIPRTLNICLHKLRDITTITTPPHGRLPVITEVRKFSENLIKQAVENEIARKGQVYILHNRVQTIETFANKLRSIMPGVKFIVAHGQLAPQELEKRIMSFTKGEFHVLISSTIIENGIDLPNANTLIVNRAEQFGLSQLYQLRGRVGRGKTQAYAYLLYHGQRLKIDAKKRLKAIVEASELGSGFQIAMKDLEIRGAGEILGASQSGAMNVVGVSHFLRMLNKAVLELQSGKKTESQQETDVTIELPITAFIPDSFISNSKDKISLYQKLSSADTLEYLKEIEEDIQEEHGRIPSEVYNLFKIIHIKILAKKANLKNVKLVNLGNARLGQQIVLTMSGQVKPENIMNMLETNNKWQISSETLKVLISDLGVHWIEALIKSLQALSLNYEAKS